MKYLLMLMTFIFLLSCNRSMPVKSSESNDTTTIDQTVIIDNEPAFIFVNKSGKTASSLYLSESTSDDWGKNLLNNELHHDQSVTIRLEEPLNGDSRYDIRIIQTNGDLRTKMKLQITQNAMITFLYSDFDYMNYLTLDKNPIIDYSVIEKIENNIGVYLPKRYIEELEKTKSHALASPKDAIIVYENKIFFIYNFHEGMHRIISGYKNKEIILSESPASEQIFIVDSNTIKNGDDDLFCKISEQIDNRETEISAYITSKIFGNKIYKDEMDNEIYRLENGKIFYKENEYEIGMDGWTIHYMINILTGDTYDYLKGKDRGYFCFSIDNERINIFGINFDGF